MGLFILSNLGQPGPKRGRPHEDRSCRCAPCVEHDRAADTGRWRPNPDALRSGIPDGTEIRATDFRDQWLSALENVSAEEVDRAAERMRQWLEPPVELDDDEE